MDSLAYSYAFYLYSYIYQSYLWEEYRKLKTMKENQPLTEKEKRELKIIDNPNIKFYPWLLARIISLVIWGTFGQRYFAPLKIRYAELKKRKDRVVKLRTKMRLQELQIDPKDYQAYYKIVREEEKRFDERFKNIK